MIGKVILAFAALACFVSATEYASPEDVETLAWQIEALEKQMSALLSTGK